MATAPSSANTSGEGPTFASNELTWGLDITEQQLIDQLSTALRPIVLPDGGMGYVDAQSVRPQRHISLGDDSVIFVKKEWLPPSNVDGSSNSTMSRAILPTMAISGAPELWQWRSVVGLFVSSASQGKHSGLDPSTLYQFDEKTARDILSRFCKATDSTRNCIHDVPGTRCFRFEWDLGNATLQPILMKGQADSLPEQVSLRVMQDVTHVFDQRDDIDHRAPSMLAVTPRPFGQDIRTTNSAMHQMLGTEFYSLSQQTPKRINLIPTKTGNTDQSMILLDKIIFHRATDDGDVVPFICKVQLGVFIPSETSEDTYLARFTDDTRNSIIAWIRTLDQPSDQLSLDNGRLSTAYPVREFDMEYKAEANREIAGTTHSRQVTVFVRADTTRVG